MSGRKQFEMETGEGTFRVRPKDKRKKTAVVPDVLWKEISGVDELDNYMKDPEKKRPKATLVCDKRVEVPLLHLVNGGLRGLELDGNLAAYFLYEQAENYKQILEEDLVFDTIEIGKKGSTVTPLSFIEVEKIDNEYPLLKLGQVAPKLFSPEVAIFLICYCHRMASAGPLATTEYLTNLATRAMNLLRVFPYYAKVDEIKNILAVGYNIGSEFVACKSTGTLIAAYDMFFRTFDTQKYSSITMATLQSYCRDYTVFVDLKFMTKLTGLEFGDWAQWVWVTDVHDELHALGQIIQYGKMRKSYFPYLRSMSVISKSPLAASVSPHLHTFIHAVGILRGDRRSFTARLVEGGIHYLIFKNVRVFLMAFGFRTEVFRMGVFRTEEEENAAIKHEEAMKKLQAISTAAAGTQPKAFDAKVWLSYALAFPRLKIPGSLDACKVVLDCISEARAGSIVESMKVEILQAMAPSQ